MTPIENEIDKVVTPIPGAKPNKDGLPYATHSGILKLGEIELEVFILNTGQRIISKSSLDNFFTEK